MEISLRQSSGVSVLELRGRLTVNDGVPELRGQVKDLLSSGQQQILLNMQGVDYMDSTGVDCLVSSYTTAVKTGGELKFSCLTDRVHHLLDITRLLTVFDTYEEEAKALQSFG
jgi:anti-sigma B factor antagonist